MKFDVFSLFQDFLSSQRDNLLGWIAVFLGIGSWIYFGLYVQPSIVQTGAMLSGCFVLCGGLFRRYHTSPDSVPVLMGFVFSVCLLCGVIGFSAAHLKTELVSAPMIDRETRPVMVEATLDHREDQEGHKGTLLFLSDVAIEKWDASKTPQNIRITTRKETDAAAGDRVKFLAKLTPLSPPVAPHSYDFARHYYFEGIGALGFALSEVSVVNRADTTIINLENIRTSIAATIQSVISEREAGIASALMTGERAAIADDDWNALRASGLAHIISISGLHVAMVAAPIFFLVRLILASIPFIALRYPIKKIAAGVALVVCCLYVGLVVPSVPTTRSLLMTGVALFAIMIDRSPFSLRLVAFSAMLVLLFSPESIWSVSFQMSFAAVTALVAMAEASRPYMTAVYADAGWIKRCGLWLLGMLTTSLVASLSTAPYSIYHFQQVASYSVLANALSVPISGIMIMPMVILSYALIPFGLAEWPLKILGLGIDWLLDIARWTQNLSGSVITTPAMPDMFLVMMTLSGLSLILLHGRMKIVFILPFAIAILSVATMTIPDVLVSDDGAVMAVKDNYHIYVSNLRKNKFATNTWRKRWNMNEGDVVLFPRASKMDMDNGGSISCDAAVCRIETGQTKIAFGSRIYELEQDCDWANIIISDERLPRDFCGNKPVQVFGHYNFIKGGALSIKTGQQMNVEQVEDSRGHRPWSVE